MGEFKIEKYLKSSAIDLLHQYLEESKRCVYKAIGCPVSVTTQFTGQSPGLQWF